MDPLLAQYALQPETLLALDSRERASWREQAAAGASGRLRWSMPALTLRPVSAAPAPCC